MTGNGVAVGDGDGVGSAGKVDCARWTVHAESSNAKIKTGVIAFIAVSFS
jgi:hypothetical protein